MERFLFLQKFIKPASLSLTRFTTKRFINVYEPSYLDKQQPFPRYPEIRVRLRSLNMPELESFAKFVHRLVKNTLPDVHTDSLTVPSRVLDVESYASGTAIVENQYNLLLHERVVQIKNMKAKDLPIISEFIQQQLPIGVQLGIKEPDVSEDEFRYVPEVDLLQLRAELRNIGAEEAKLAAINAAQAAKAAKTAAAAAKVAAPAAGSAGTANKPGAAGSAPVTPPKPK